jgi:hypothetical protein
MAGENAQRWSWHAKTLILQKTSPTTHPHQPTLTLSTPSADFVTETFSVNVQGGYLELKLSTLDSPGSYAAISSLIVVNSANTQFKYSFGTPFSPVAPAYTKITEYASGPIYWFGTVQAYDSGPAGISPPTTWTVLARYTYDALNNRIETSTDTTQWTLYNGTTPLLDFNSLGVVTTWYLSDWGCVARGE